MFTVIRTTLFIIEYLFIITKQSLKVNNLILCGISIGDAYRHDLTFVVKKAFIKSFIHAIIRIYIFYENN